MGALEPYYKGNHKRCERCFDVKPGVHFPKKDIDVCSLCVNKEEEKEINKEFTAKRRKAEERMEEKDDPWSW